MKNAEFVKLGPEHEREVMDIFNYYIENSFSAYPETRLPYEFFGRFIEMTKGYPAYSMVLENKVVGFCFIRAYNPFPTFRHTAEITYFIHKDHKGKGLGKKALDLLEKEASKMGISVILASISSLNFESINFHIKYGFSECGRFKSIGIKSGRYFDVVWMQKNIK